MQFLWLLLGRNQEGNIALIRKHNAPGQEETADAKYN